MLKKCIVGWGFFYLLSWKEGTKKKERERKRFRTSIKISMYAKKG